MRSCAICLLAVLLPVTIAAENFRSDSQNNRKGDKQQKR
jgi:hypothetical protein